MKRDPLATDNRLLGLVRQARLAAPAIATVLLAFNAGGFFFGATAVLATALAVLAAIRITTSASPFAGWSVPVAVAAVALGLLAAWTLASALWSDAPFRGMVEFDRTLAYLLAMALMGSFAARDGDLDRGLSWLAGAFTIVATAALLTRLFPGTFPSEVGRAPARLSFPLTYWNATGIFFAIGLALAVHVTAGGRSGRVLRVAAAGAVPLMATALYFTFSRGGIAAVCIALVTYVVLARPRRLPAALVAILPTSAVAVIVAYGADALASEDYVHAGSQGTRVGVAVGGCVVAAMALRALALWLDRRVDRLEVSRGTRRRIALGAAVLAAACLLGAVVAVDLPQRVDDKVHAFATAESLTTRGDQRKRLDEVSANGRIRGWRVARDMFEREPLRGMGAGTYRSEWLRARENDQVVVDAHTLYLETLAELGIVGLGLLLVALLVPLVAAARRLGGPERHAHAAFLAAAAALLVHAAVDWDWEMPAVFLWFAAFGGLVCAARVRTDRVRPVGRVPRIVAGLGCLLLAVTPARVALSQPALDEATKAFKRGDCPTAIDRALASAEAAGMRPEPFEILGYCDLRLGQRTLAIRAMRAAVARDGLDWQYSYGLAVAQALSGEDPRPAARAALARNPRSELAQELAEGLRGGPRRWARAAAHAKIPYE